MTTQEQILKQHKINELLNLLDDDCIKYPILCAIIEELRMLLDEKKGKEKEHHLSTAKP